MRRLALIFTVAALLLTLLSFVQRANRTTAAAPQDVPVKVGVNRVIGPPNFDHVSEFTSGNAQTISASADGAEAIANVIALNQQGGNATAAVGVHIVFDWDEPPDSGELIENALVRTEVDFEYQIDAGPDPQEGAASAEVSIEPRIVSGFARSETNGMDQNPMTHVFTTTVGEYPGLLSFVANVHASAGDVGPVQLESRANARIEVGQIRMVFLVDLVAFGLEVTQGIQNLPNDVDLVAGKTTYVRLHTFVFRPEDDGQPTTAQLRVTKDGSEVVLNPVRDIRVQHRPNRAIESHAFLFQLPTSHTSGTLTLRAELNHTNDRARSPNEMLYENNELEQTVSFLPTSPLNLTIVDMQYRRCPECPLEKIGDVDVTQLTNWLAVAYPTPKINYRTKTYVIPTVNPNSADVLAAVRRVRRSEVNDDAGRRCAVTIGLVDDANGANFIRGLADVGDYTAMAPAGANLFPTDTDGSYADWYGAHEIAHALGRHHVACRNEMGVDPNFPHLAAIRASISQTADPDPYGQTYGFDWKHASGNLQIYTEQYRDVMSYCQPQWISEYTYEALRPAINTLAAACTGSPSTAANYLLVTGIITVTNNITTTALRPLFRLPVVLAPTADVNPTHAIVLRDGANVELARTPFLPYAVDPDDLDPNAVPPGTTLALIDELVPYVAGTLRVEIEDGNGTVIAVITAGAAEPTVTISPLPRAADALQTIMWSANDGDGDPLTYMLQYTPDNGTTWLTLATDLTATSYTVDTDELPAGTQARFRVLATDNINTDFSDSAPFVLANHLPTVAIVNPADGATAATGQTVVLEGHAYDTDNGTLDDAALSWSSSLDGALGSGANLALNTLSSGTHNIVLAADDGDGGNVSTAISLTVVTTLDALPAVPDQLQAAPTALALAGDGPLSVTLTVENLSGNLIGWTAVASDAWLALDPASGMTGDTITVTALPTGLANIIYSGTISLTAPTRVGTPVVVPVTFDNTAVPTAIGASAQSASGTVWPLLGALAVVLASSVALVMLRAGKD